MTESDAGEQRDTTEAPASPSDSPTLESSGTPAFSYGNIYTPHAGSMIIHMQRESGLQSRMIVLGPRRVRLLRFLTSRAGKITMAAALAVLLIVAVEAARVPALMRRVSRMEHTTARLDSLERSLGQLQQRYDQVRAMMGADSNAPVGVAAVPRSLTPMPAITPRLGTPVSPDMDGQTGGVAGARSTTGEATSGGLEGAPAATTAVADPSQPDAPAATPVHRRRRRPAAEATTDTAAPTPPDTGAAPSTQAEPQ